MRPAGFCGETASAMARRASSSKDWRSSSERDGILGLFVALHHAQLAALLDAVVQLAPEFQKVLRRRHQRTDHHQPEKHKREGIQIRMASASNQNRHGAYLQNHFRLAQQGSRNRKSLG